MPYYIYRNFTKSDLLSVILYIRSIPAVRNLVPPNVYGKSGNPGQTTLTPVLEHYRTSFKAGATNRRGAYLATVGKCIDCHTVGRGGVYKPANILTGGREFRFPLGIVRSANLTPHKKAGIGNYTKKLFVERFTAYQNFPKDVLLGLDPSTMAWSEYTHLRPADLESIYAFLFSRQPVANFVEPYSPYE